MRSPFTLRRAARGGLVAVVAFGAAAVAGSGLQTPASAQDPAGRVLTVTELEKGATFIHVRNTKTKRSRSALLGDLIVFTNPLADPAGKVVGKLQAQCVTTTGSNNFLTAKLTCSGVMTLPGGTLTLQAITSPGSPTTNGAITGGTAAYANARGTFTSPEGKADTITLVG